MGKITSDTFDLVADLASQIAVNGVQVKVNGRTAFNDGLSDVYIYNASSTATADGVNIVAVTGVATGRWIKKNPVPASNIPIGNLLASDLTTSAPRSNGTISSATITVNVDTTDNYNVTTLAVNTTIAAPSGTPVQNQELILRITSDATIRTLTWNAIFRAGSELPLPANTVASKTLYLAFIYNVEAVKWDFVGSTTI